MAMNKPNDWDTMEGKEFGENENLPAGVYKCRIMSAYSQTSKSGNEMLVLELDIVEGEHEGHFAKLADVNEKLLFQCRYYQLTEGNSAKFYKGLINCIEQSNPGYKWDFEPSSLKGKLCCGAFGKEQYVSNKDGSLQWSTRLTRVTSLENMEAGLVQIPKDKYVDGQAASTSPPPPTYTTPTSPDFYETDETLDDDDLPF